MRPARDTFLRFLSDNISLGIPLHNVRKDANFPEANVLKMNAVNVQFLTDTPRVDVSDLSVAVDVVFDDELAAIDIATKTFLLLSQSGMTPLLDYTDRLNPPVSLGSNLFWDTDKIRFRPIPSDTYFRHSAMMTLSYHLYQAYQAP